MSWEKIKEVRNELIKLKDEFHLMQMVDDQASALNIAFKYQQIIAHAQLNGYINVYDNKIDNEIPPWLIPCRILLMLKA